VPLDLPLNLPQNIPLNMDVLTRLLPGRPLHYFPVTASTMTLAAKRASAGAPHGSLFIADEQTAGVGRFGRTWHSEANTGIYLTIVLRLGLPVHALSVLTLALGLAAAETIQAQTSLCADLRWPNDVLIGERKVAGILAQLSDDCVLAGIGINVNQATLPAGLSEEAISLKIAAGWQAFPREPMIAGLVANVDRRCTMLIEEGPAATIEAFTLASSYARNKRVVFEGPRGENDCKKDGADGRPDIGMNRGVTAGLDPQGFLLVRRAAGDIVTIMTGGIRPDPRT
jgi:BirA family transcriptional regulator, biotin operon repressor / biotin---[acetyl-CoA-carboxylase] ligase